MALSKVNNKSKSAFNIFDVFKTNEDGNGGRGGEGGGYGVVEINICDHSLSKYFGPPKSPATITVSTASAYADSSGFRGPKPNENIPLDFPTLLKIFGGNNTYLRDTFIDALRSSEGFLTQVIMPWENTKELQWSGKVRVTERKMAERTGSQVATRGLSTWERTYSVVLAEYGQDFEQDGTFYLTEEGRADYEDKCKALVASFILRMNRLIMTQLGNHEEIKSVLQNDFNRMVIPIQQLYAQLYQMAFPAQKAGHQGFSSNFFELRRLLRDNGAEPTHVIVNRGFKLLLNNVPKDSVFILAGDRQNDNLDRGDDSKTNLFEPKVYVHEYNDDGLVDPDSDNPYVGTLTSVRSFGGVATSLPSDAGSNLDTYRSEKRYFDLLDMSTNGKFTVTIADALEHSMMFDASTGQLHGRHWEVKRAYNQPNGRIRDSFKAHSMMMFPNADLALNANINQTFYDVALWIGEAVSSTDLCKMVITMLNDKTFSSFKNLIKDLSDAIALSHELSTEKVTTANAALYVTAVRQAGTTTTPEGDLITKCNRYGSIDLPQLEERTEGENGVPTGTYWIYYAQGNNKLYVTKKIEGGSGATGLPWFQKEGDASFSTETAYLLNRESIVPKGWGTVGGIHTLANVGSGTLMGQLLGEPLLLRASRAVAAFRQFYQLAEKLLPRHPCFDVNKMPQFLKGAGSKAKYAKIASVCECLLTLPKWPFYMTSSAAGVASPSSTLSGRTGSAPRFASSVRVEEESEGGVSGDVTDVEGGESERRRGSSGGGGSGGSSSSITTDTIKNYLNQKRSTPSNILVKILGDTLPKALTNPQNFKQYKDLFDNTNLGKLFEGSYEKFYAQVNPKANTTSRSQKQLVVAMTPRFVNGNFTGKTTDQVLGDMKDFEFDTTDVNLIKNTILGVEPSSGSGASRRTGTGSSSSTTSGSGGGVLEVYVCTRLHLDLSSFAGVTANIAGILAPFNPRTRMLLAANGSGRFDIPDDAELLHSDAVQTLYFMADGASNSARAGQPMDAARTRADGQYISSHLRETIRNAIERPDLTNDVARALLLGLATSPNELDVWISWDTHHVHFPAIVQVVRPSRLWRCYSFIVLDNRGMGNTYINRKYSNTVIGDATVERWFKVSSRMWGGPQIKDPYKVVRNDLGVSAEYVGGEDSTWFDEDEPFDPSKVAQKRSNMCFLMPTNTPLYDFPPLRGFYQRESFAQEAAKNLAIDFNTPSRGSIEYYLRAHNMDPVNFPAPVLPNAIVGLNKDDTVMEQFLPTMWCAKWNPATSTNTSVETVTDPFQNVGSYVGCKAARNGQYFGNSRNATSQVIAYGY